MPTITINDEPYRGEDTVALLSELLENLTQSHLDEGELVTKVFIDDDLYPLGGSDTSLQEKNSIAIYTAKDPKAAVANLLEQIGEYLDSVTDGMTQISDTFRAGATEEANSLLVHALEGLGTFFELIETVELVGGDDLSTVSFGEETITSRMERTTTLLEDIKGRQEANDWVAVADALEYELKPMVADWRGIIPQLQAHIVKS